MAETLDYETILPPVEASRAQKLSWILYDWANSGYGLIIIGPVFTPYFISHLLPVQPGLAPAADGSLTHGLRVGSILLPGSAVVGIMTSMSMALMALGAPLMGAIADIKGWTKRLLIIHAGIGSLLAMSMYFLSPGQWKWAAVLYVASNYCFGASSAFYNAYLPKLTHPDKQGSLSGWGFALGYAGGAVALILAGMLPVRWGLALAGIWWLVFSLPAFIFLREFPANAQATDRGSLFLAGFRRIGHTFRNIRHYRMLFLFLLAFLLYNDGIETVIAMSPSYGIEVLKMSDQELIRMFLIVQGVAFCGAIAFGYLADKLGNKIIIISNLIVWILAAVAAFYVTTGNQFTLLGIIIGLVLGGVQASSRALMGLLAPKHIHNEAFGFFSISGKFASILGPLLYSTLATWKGPRAGIFSVLPFLILGLFLLLGVKEPTTTNQLKERLGTSPN